MVQFPMYVEDERGNVYQRVDADDAEETLVKPTKNKVKAKKPVAKLVAKPAATKAKKPAKQVATKGEPTKKPAKRKASEMCEEVLDEEAMQAKTMEERRKKYLRCCKFKREYEKEENAKKWDEMDPVLKADKLLTKAASIRKIWDSLVKKDLSEKGQLSNAVGPLRSTGERKFEEAMQIVASLKPEDVDRLWQLQVRNKDVKSFDELVTKKAYADAAKPPCAGADPTPAAEQPAAATTTNDTPAPAAPEQPAAAETPAN